jgi:hypothetical protein
MFRKRFQIVLILIIGVTVFSLVVCNKKTDAAVGSLASPTSGIEIKSGDRYEFLMDIETDSLGNTYYLVEEVDTEFTDYDIFLYKITPQGTHEWTGGRELGTHADSIYDEEMVSDGSDGLILSWQSGASPNSTVAVQRMDSNGNFLWGSGQNDPLIIKNGLTNPNIVSIADGNGGAFVAWTDTIAYAQHIDASGNKLWGDNGVSINTSNAVGLLQMTADQSGGVIIVFSIDGGATAEDLYAQRLDSDGAKLWGNDGKLVVNANYDQEEAQIVTDGANGAYIAWTDYRIGGPSMESNIYLQRLNASGDPFGGTWVAGGITAITANGISEERPRMLRNTGSEGGVFLTWNQDAGASSDIKLQWINETGAKKYGNSGTTISSAEGQQHDPEFALTTGGIVMVWEDSRWGEYEIYGQYVTDVDTIFPHINWPVADGEGINLTPTNPSDPFGPMIAALPSGGLVSGWNNYRTDGCCSNTDVFSGKIIEAYQITVSGSTYLDVKNAEGHSIKRYSSTKGAVGQDVPVTLTDLKNWLIAYIPKVDMLSDLTWTGEFTVRGASYRYEGLAYVTNLATAQGVDGAFNFYVPKRSGSTAVVLCYTFSGIEDINLDCPDKVFKNENSPGVSIIERSGQEYWEITGLTQNVAGFNYPAIESESCSYTLSYYDDQLRVLDMYSGVTKSKRSLNYSGVVNYAAGFAKDPTNSDYYAVMYLDEDEYPSLTKVNVETAEVTVVAALEDYFTNLTFSTDGTLYGTVESWADAPYKLYTINKTTGVATTVADLSSTGDGGETIAFSSKDNQIYHLAGSTERVFEQIDTGTYASTQIDLTNADYDTPLGLYYWALEDAFIFSDYYNDSLYRITFDEDLGQYSMVYHTAYNKEEGHVGFAYKGACDDAPLPSEIPLTATNNQVEKIDLVMSLPFETYNSVSLRKRSGECTSTNFFTDHTDGTEIYSPTNPTSGQQISFSDTDVSGTTKYCYAVFGQNANGWNDLALLGITTNYATGWAAIDADPPPTNPTDENNNTQNNNGSSNNIENSSLTTPQTPTSYPISYSSGPEKMPSDGNTNDDLVTFETTSTGVGDSDKESKDQIVTVENVLKFFTYILLASTATASVLSTSAALSTVSIAVIPKAIPFLIWKKHKNPWGVVRNSLTREPIAHVSVKAFNSAGNVIGSTMTDLEGQYAFKSGLNPSRLEFQHHSYNKMQKEINLAGPIEKGMLDIEMKPKSNNSLDSKTLDTLDARRGLVSITKKLFIIGFIVTIITTVIYPVTINIIITGLYFVFAVFYIIRDSRKSKF